MSEEVKLETAAQTVVDGVAKEPESEVQATSEDMAAHDYQQLMPKFWALIEPMSRRQQQRVFKGLMEYPLESDLPRFSYKEEKEAFYLGLQINDCKFVLQKAVMELVQNKEKMDAFNEDLKKLTEEKGNDLQSGLSNQGHVEI